MRRLALSLLAATTLASPAFAQVALRDPVETSSPNAPDQKPAFEGQTRAPQPAADAKVSTQTVAEGLPHFWAMEFLPDNRVLATAKDGAMHILGTDFKPGPEIEGVPEVASSGQGGLLDVALAPDFTQSGTIVFSFSEPRDGGNGTSVARAKLVADENGGGSLQDMQVIFRQMPTYDGNKHFGSRLAFAPDGNLFVTVGERSDEPIRDQAQDPKSGLGKVFRITLDGKPAEGNPFAGQDGVPPEIFSTGHRNVQSAVIDGQGRLWEVEHGAKGGDELNLVQAGKNYGWPTITYGIAYSGKPIGEGITQKEGLEQPVYYWDPVIGPSGMALYEADAIPEWKGAILVGGLVSQGLVVLKLEGDKVASEERLDLDARIRDVKVGPDGAVFALTESRGGSSSIIRIAPEG